MQSTFCNKKSLEQSKRAVVITSASKNGVWIPRLDAISWESHLMGVEAGNDLGSWFQLLRDLWFQVDAP